MKACRFDVVRPRDWACAMGCALVGGIWVLLLLSSFPVSEGFKSGFLGPWASRPLSLSACDGRRDTGGGCVTGDGGLEDELRTLRRGEAVYAVDLGSRIGPRLRRLAAVAVDDDAEVVRRKVVDWIMMASEPLDAEPRLAVRAAVAVQPADRGRFLGERLAWLAEEWRCDPRTARRKVDRAFRLFAEAVRAHAGHDPAPNSVYGWLVASFVAVLRMDADPPEALELRRIVATMDGLAELVTSISVPRHPDDRTEGHGLHAELLYGGHLERRAQPYESYFENVITLASPLVADAEHWYAMRLTVPRGQPMAPHYVHIPFARTEYFCLRIRFGPDRMPQRVWRLTRVPPVVIYDRQPTGDLLRADRFGEVSCEFRDLTPGFGYGIRWEYF